MSALSMLSRLSRLAAAPIAPMAGLLRRGGLLSAPTRGIITVDVYQGNDRGLAQDSASRARDIARSEEIALSQYNRLVSQEMHRGCLLNGARRMKRFARYTKPTLARRTAGRATRWKGHKKKLLEAMNWLQYRQRAEK